MKRAQAVVISLMFCRILLKAQGGGVFDPKVYRNAITECISQKHYSVFIRKDSIPPNHVMLGGMIWRKIDGPELKLRLSMAKSNPCEVNDFFELIKTGLTAFGLRAFHRDDFHHTMVRPLTTAEITSRLRITDSLPLLSFNADGEPTYLSSRTEQWLNSSHVLYYLCKEDWIFDSYHSRLEKHLVAIAPVVADSAGGEGKVLFWLYYPEWEGLFALFGNGASHNGHTLSYKDLFNKQYFRSGISKERNLYKRDIHQYRHGDDALLESEMIKERIRNMESDLFQH